MTYRFPFKLSAVPDRDSFGSYLQLKHSRKTFQVYIKILAYVPNSLLDFKEYGIRLFFVQYRNR